MFFYMNCVVLLIDSFNNSETFVLIFFVKIIALNKTKERMRPYHVHQEEEDPDIKKIKKVCDHTDMLTHSALCLTA